MRILFLIIVFVPQVVLASPDWRMGVRFGQNITLDEGHGLVSESSTTPSGEIGMDLFFWDLTPSHSLGIGASYYGHDAEDVTYQRFDTRLDVDSLRLHTLYRWSMSDSVALITRVGAEYSDTELTLSDGFAELVSESTQWGLFGGLGVDYFFGPALGKNGADSAFGVSMEVTYSHFREQALSVEGTPLGTLNSSGPGWLVGVSYVW